MQQILILGGTLFSGRLLSESLARRTDVEVTLFHRGKTNPGLFPEFRHLQGDRNSDEDIRQINRRDWDAVIDFCAYYPQPLERLARSLCGRAGRYLLISSVSAYTQSDADNGQLLKEDHPLLACSKAEETDTQMQTYGKRKAACERLLLNLPELHPVVFRPGLIYGPYDSSDRFYYWLWRFARQPDILVPDLLSLRTHWTYAPDLALILEQALLGPQPKGNQYHILTHSPQTFQTVFDALAQVCRHRPRQTRVSSQWLQDHELELWRDFPLFLPFERLFDMQAMQQDFVPALTSFERSLEVSRDYFASLGWPVPQVGLSPEQEAEWLKKV